MRAVNIGGQRYDDLIEHHDFYVDKTPFIKEWWESRDPVTLITRPRRFGKTLNMDMLNCFFSNRYAGRGDLFEGLQIWKDEKYRNLQGTYPVIFLSFADVKQNNYKDARISIIRTLQAGFEDYRPAWEQMDAQEKERYFFCSITPDSSDADVSKCLQQYSDFLYAYYHKNISFVSDWLR